MGNTPLNPEVVHAHDKHERQERTKPAATSYFRQGVKRGSPANHGWVRGEFLRTGDAGASVYDIQGRSSDGHGHSQHVVKRFRKPSQGKQRKMHCRRVVQEVGIVRELQSASLCDYFVKLKDVFEDKAAVYVILEKLHSLEGMKHDGTMGEAGLNVVHRVMYAVHLLHQHGISHGDLGLASIGVTADGKVKIMDFGKSVRHEKGSRPPEFEEDIAQLAGVLKQVAHASAHRELQDLVSAMEHVRPHETMRHMIDCGVEFGLFPDVEPQAQRSSRRDHHDHHHHQEDYDDSPTGSADHMTEEYDDYDEEGALKRFLGGGGGGGGGGKSGESDRLRELRREHAELLASNRKYKSEIAVFESLLKKGHRIMAWK